MNPVSSKTTKPMVSPHDRKDGRHSRPGYPPESKTPSLRKSRRMALFWLRLGFEPGFDYPSYKDRVQHFQSKLKLQEVTAAMELYQSLKSDERSRSRFLAQYPKIHPPRIRETRVPEKRTIGVGYRDKGALRPYHSRGRDHGEVVLWSGDIKYLLPLDFPEDVWITREEVNELCGGENTLHLAMGSIFSLTSEVWTNLYSQANQSR